MLRTEKVPFLAVFGGSRKSQDRPHIGKWILDPKKPPLFLTGPPQGVHEPENGPFLAIFWVILGLHIFNLLCLYDLLNYIFVSLYICSVKMWTCLRKMNKIMPMPAVGLFRPLQLRGLFQVFSPYGWDIVYFLDFQIFIVSLELNLIVCYAVVR